MLSEIYFISKSHSQIASGMTLNSFSKPRTKDLATTSEKNGKNLMNGILCSSKYCCLIFLLLHFFYLIHFKTGSKCCVTISSSQPLPYTHLKKRFFLCRKSIFRIHRSLAGIATMNITLNLTNRFETFISLSASFGWLGVHLRSRQSYLPS